MQLHVVPMTLTFARCIVQWQYEGPYAVYNYDKSAAYLLDANNWGRVLFAVTDDAGQLVGELTVGFVDAREEWLPEADIAAGRMADATLWLGFGLRPDLTGHGLGLAFVRTCTDFAIQWAAQRYGYSGEYIGLRVFAFNQRAIKVYERAGFQQFAEGSRTINGTVWKTQLMRMCIK